MSSFRRLVREIHRRSLWQVVGIYLVGGWVALQVVHTLVDSLGLPDWFPAFAVMLLIVGLPVVVATAFVQEGPGRPRGEDGAAGGEDRTPAPANLAAGTGSLDRLSTRPPRIQRLLTWRNAIAGGVLAFALWGVIAAGWLALERWVAGPTARGAVGIGGEPDAHVRSIAVLPFQNLSSDQENAHFADGIHEDVLTQLSRIHDLTVISRTSVMAYRESDKPLSQIARELGVGSILEGSVRRAGESVRISAQLIDARTDRHVWADNYDRDLTVANVFAIQTDIARRIADALSATLSEAEVERIARLPTESLSAYDFHVRGREAYRRYDRDGNEEAIRLFQRAVEIDPGYADAWAGLADAYGLRVWSHGYPREWADSAEVLARRAIDLAPDLAAGWKALALTYVVRRWHRRAMEANLKALELDPSHAAAVGNLAVSAAALGRFDEAQRWTRRAAQLDPTNLGQRSNLAIGYMELGEPALARVRLREVLELNPAERQALGALARLALLEADTSEARRQLESLLRLAPEDAQAHGGAAQLLLEMGDAAGAVRGAEKALELSPGLELQGGASLVRTTLGAALLRRGEGVRGRALLQESLRIRSAHLDEGMDDPSIHWELAGIHAQLGEREAALDRVERAFEGGYRQWYVAESDPLLEPLRGEPRLTAVVQRIREDVERQRRSIEAEEVAAGLR